MFGTTKSWFLVRRGRLSSQSPAEALLGQVEHLFKAHYATKIRFTASETTKVGLNHPKWPRNTLVTILQHVSTSCLEPKNRDFWSAVADCPTRVPVPAMWPWLISLQRLQIVSKIIFGTPKPLEMSSTDPKWPKNTLVTNLDTYLDSILKMKKTSYFSPPPRTTTYFKTFFTVVALFHSTCSWL